MIAAIIFIALGILTLVLMILLRKKIFKSAAWAISVIAVAAVFFTAGGMKISGRVSEIRDSREKIYLGVMYLKSYDRDSASFYFNAASVTDNCPSAAAKYLLEKMRGNELSARLYLDAAESYAKKDEELDLVDILGGVDVNDYEQVEHVADSIEDLLKISEKRKPALDLYINGGWSTADEDDIKSLGLRAGEIERLEISDLLSYGDYGGALSEAVKLADEHPNEKNRLLLASVIAEGSYNGVIYTAKDFATGEHKRDQSVTKEKEKLNDAREDAENELKSVEMSLSGAKSDSAIQRLNQRKLDLTEEINDLRKRSDKIFVYRAFNAIADLHSLNARIVRARLYFALDEYDKCVKELLDAAQSVEARLTPDRRLAGLLSQLSSAYESEDSYYGSDDFRECVKEILSSPFDDLVFSAHSRLTDDLAERVMSDQKVYGKSIQVSGIDLSRYPTVTLNITGKENVLQQIVDRKEVLVKDTHYEITSYTAELSSGTDCDVSVVADVSGSMDGEPLRNLKQALNEFISTSSDGVSISLVEFESYANLVAPLTDDKATLLAKIDELYGGGGTDITSGIRAGMESLEDAGANKVMLLMTDGQSSIDYSVVDEAAARGIVIHTIGFGGVDSELLQEIADRTGGQFVLADSSSELVNVYASLQQIIGNSLRVEYTVTETEDINRYFFVSVGEYSAYRDYVIESATNEPTLWYSSKSLITSGDVDYNTRWGYNFRISLYGANLSKVETVTVGGVQATVRSKYDNELSIEFAPNLRAGWQDVRIKLFDGTEQSYDRLIYVGDAVRLNSVSFGDLTAYSVSALKDGQNLIMFGEFDVEGESDHGVLSLRLYGTLTVPYSGSIEEYADVTVGTSVNAECYGQIRLNYDDDAYQDGSQCAIASGSMVFECKPGSSRIVMADRGDEI